MPTSDEPGADLDIFAVLSVLWSNRKIIVGAPLSIGVLTLGITFLIPPTFTANAVLVPPAQQSSSTLSAIAGQLGALGGLAGAAGAMKTPADQYVSFLKSRNVSDRVIEQFKLKEIYDKELHEDTRRAFNDNVRVTAGKKDGLISIEVDDHDPKRAAAMANTLVDELRRINSEFAVGEASQRRAFFEIQLKEAKQALANAEAALNASGVSTSALNAAPQAAVAAVAKLKAAVTAQEVRVASMQGFFTDENPDLKQARLELTVLRSQLNQIEQGTPAGVGRENGRYLETYRNFKYQETLFELIAKQYELARLDEAREGSVIQVLDVAVVPERKSKPKKGIITVTVTVGVGVGLVMLLLLYELWWRRLKPRTSASEGAGRIPAP